MRFVSLTCLLIVFAMQVQAQPWLENLPEGKSRKELTFFDYRQAFESYWAPFNVTDGYYVENGEKKKAPGWKQFKRWEYIMEHRADMKTGTFPQQSALAITREHQKTHPPARSSAISDWKQIGPTFSNGGQQGIGRMNCVAFHPTDLNTYWAGAASGGLWFTHNDGEVWTCLTDQQESLGVTDIIIPEDYDQSQTIYIATGDKDSYDVNSVGVLKSIDGGLIWNPTGLSYELAERNFINRLIQHPFNPEILIAATVDGAFRTVDGGVTWDEQLSAQAFIDMEFHPTNPDIIYGSNFEGEFFVSTNNGDTWTRTINDLAGKRTEIAVTKAAPDWVYAITESGGLDSIYKSTDRGATFTRVFDGSILNLLHWNANGIGPGGQGYYDLGFDASPIDPNILFVGGINTWRSRDGGNTWQIVNHFTGSLVQAVHADKHSLRFSQNGDVWECNDGGVYVSYDQGDSWKDKTNGIAISQMYKMGNSATDPDEIITGLQDNGSKLHTAGGWMQVNGADGMEGMIDYSDVNIQYSTTQSGSFFRTLNHWETARYVKPGDAGEGAWVTPFAMDPVDPKVIYGGYRDLWKTTDRGDTWAKVSSILFGDKIRSIAIAPSDPNTIYIAGTYRMWKSTTAGEPFIRLTGNVPDHSNAMSYISVKKDDPQTLWVAVSGFFGPGVFQSIDGGENWTDISAGLPKIPVYTVIQNNQAIEEVELFAGTELGVYFKKGDEEWVPFNTGFPNVIVTELEMHYASAPSQSKLRASTYGRGLWETRIAFESSPMQYISCTTKQNNTIAVKPNQAKQEILKIEINTQGDLEPIHVHSFSINTNGSTDPMTDITNAHVFYTGFANGFNTDVPFGEAYVLPNASFTIEGDQELVNGVNYFWLAYDIPLNATIGNILDAQCDSINIGTDVIPAISDPEGNRRIELIYCPAGSTNLSQDYISRVTMGGVDQASVKGANGYEDHTNQVIEMEVGVTVPISVSNNAPHTGNELRIWVDWNIDADFEDPDELVYASGPLSITTYNTSFAPPGHARTGLTRMRIRLHDTTFGPNATPCDVANLGEVEDYSIQVAEVMTGESVIKDKTMISIHPNPVNTTLYISIPENESPTKLRIFNILGEMKYENTILGNTTLDFKDYSPGIYFFIFENASGNQISKLIKAE